MFDEVHAAPAVLTFLRDTRVGRMVPLALREEWRGDTSREVDREGGEGGLGLPKNVFFLRFSSSFSFGCEIFSGAAVSFVFTLYFLMGCWGPFYDRFCRPGARENGYLEKPTTTATALRVACSGIIQDNKQTKP